LAPGESHSPCNTAHPPWQNLDRPGGCFLSLVDASLVSREGIELDHARIVKVGTGFRRDVEVLRTAYQSQTFARHTHDTYTLGLVLDGAGTFWCRGAERLACAGDVVVIPPGEVHTGSVGTGVDSLSYLAVYLPVDLAAMYANSAGTRGGKPPEFGEVVLRDAVVRRAYQALDRAIGSADSPGHRPIADDTDGGEPFDDSGAEEAVAVAITELIRRHADQRTPDTPDRNLGMARESRLVHLVREVLEDSFANADETSLHVLAQRTGVTPFRVIRAFREATGLAPHQYLIQVRVERARQYLADGAVPSLVAAMTGFVDQSHLTYHFKRHLGITPGSYRRCVGPS
jgi:AraC-like DNA-binding protein/mannose-6-phosphate isomerase-like protein (cupin superfamily)